jgi:GT2 family glycosyltransferase
MPNPVVSFLISTFNRREAILHTLAELHGAASPLAPSEIIVVDNASADQTAGAIRERFPNVQLLCQTVNRGPCAKNLGLTSARGKYIVFLDDDSFPAPGAIDRMIGHFENDPNLGAAIFAVRLPSGAEECSAYPQVFAGCGVGFRKEAIEEVGGLPEDYFMQAEEYDLSLRLLDAGWTINRFEDLAVQHLKTPASRFPSRVMRLDVRNNLTLIGRYFPDEWVVPFAMDWATRYRLIASANRRLPAYFAGLAEGLIRLTSPRDRRPISDATFETFAKMELIAHHMNQASRSWNIKRLLLVDLGKNMLPYWLAAQHNGLEIVAIADAKLGGRGFSYRGKPILPDDQAQKLSFDAAVISNLSPVHAPQRRQAWADRTDRPVLDFLRAA